MQLKGGGEDFCGNPTSGPKNQALSKRKAKKDELAGQAITHERSVELSALVWYVQTF